MLHTLKENGNDAPVINVSQWREKDKKGEKKRFRNWL